MVQCRNNSSAPSSVEPLEVRAPGAFRSNTGIKRINRQPKAFSPGGDILVSFRVDYTCWFNEITGHGLLLHCHFTRRTLPVLSSILAEELCESSRRKPSAELDTQSSESKQNNTTSIYV